MVQKIPPEDFSYMKKNTPYSEYYKKKNREKIVKEKLKQQKSENMNNKEKLKKENLQDKTTFLKNFNEKNKKSENSEKNIEQDYNQKYPIITSLQEIEEKAKQKVEKIRSEMEIKTSQKRNIEKIIIISIYFITLLLITYFILTNITSDKMPIKKNEYIINAENSKIQNTFSEFYIKNTDVLGDKIKIKDKVIRPIIKTKKFEIIFKPKVNLEKDTIATFHILFLLNKTSDIYLNNQLIFPNLKDYELVYETNTDYIYIKEKLLKNFLKNNLKEILKEFKSSKYKTTENFVLDKFKGYSFWSTRDIDLITIKPEDYKEQKTIINQQFKGNLKLAVYTENELIVNFTKQDMNRSVGIEEYIVNITDIEGKLIFQESFGYKETNKKEKQNKSQNYEIKLTNLPKGIYYINFILNNNKTDSTIKNIILNTNKVLIIGKMFPLKPGEFYTKQLKNSKIKFYNWKDKNQLIKIKQENKLKIINTNKTGNLKIYEQYLTKGEKIINIEKGNLGIDINKITLKKQNWFEIPTIQKMNFNSPDIAIIDKVTFKPEKDYDVLSYSRDIKLNNKTTQITMQVLEPETAYLDKMRLIINK